MGRDLLVAATDSVAFLLLFCLLRVLLLLLGGLHFHQIVVDERLDRLIVGRRGAGRFGGALCSDVGLHCLDRTHQFLVLSLQPLKAGAEVRVGVRRRPGV